MHITRDKNLKARRGLAVVAWLVTVSTLAAQSVAPPPATGTPEPGRDATTTEPVNLYDEAPIMMSPFEVDASNDIGYYAENTLAGTRLRTNVGDLASSITIVTKQQLEDTASVDINDVFLYESNTEGAYTYTPFTLNRGVVRDSIGGYAQDTGELNTIATANRVRGLGSVDTAQNNHPTISRLAFDAYNTNTVEINRGPNSMLFGTGSAAGIVNQSTSEAVLGQQHTTINARIGSYDSWRASIGTNVPIGDKVALYFAALYDDRGFARKPSYDIYRRQYGAVTIQPFRTTKITASFENYDNRHSRANFAAPIDSITPWLEAGRPGWNPVTNTITIMDTGQVLGPYVETTLDARWPGPDTTTWPVGNGALTNSESPLYVPGIGFNTRNQLYIDNEAIVGFWVGQLTAGSNTTVLPPNADRTQEQREIASRRLTQSVGPLAPVPPPETGATHWGNWYRTGVTDRSIYDWKKYNAQGANHGRQDAKSFNLEFQQQILRNLNLSLGWLRQEMDETGHYGLGQANTAVELRVDTNTHLLDGTPNPYFGTPYVTDYQADTFERPEINDSRRAMLAYEVDFTRNDNWTRHLGSHRFLGLLSTQRRALENLRYRFSFSGGDPRFLPGAASNPGAFFTWAGNAATMERRYYMGMNPNGVVERGSTTVGEAGWGGPSHATLGFYDWANNRIGRAEMSFQPNLFYAGGNYGLTERIVDSSNIAWQGRFWNDRITPTMGWRKDKLAIRRYDAALSTDAERYTNGFGNLGPHRRLGAPYRIEGSTSTRGVVIRPFRNWDRIENRADNGSFVADFIRGLSFHYNESDNFNAPENVRQDFFGNILPKPSGEGKDWGFGGSMFNNSLSFKVNWYKATNEYASSPAADTAISRAVRVDTSMRAWAERVVRIRHGLDPSDEFFLNNTVNPLTPQMAADIQALWGLPYDLETSWPDVGNNAGIFGTESNVSRGMEVQLIYNPTRNWNIKWTLGKQDASYSDAVGELSEWIAYRKPMWEGQGINPATGHNWFTAPDLDQEYTLFNGNKMYLATAWDGYGYPEAGSNNQGQTGSLRGFYTSAVESQLFQVTALQGASAPNLRKWSTTIMTNYAFQQGRLRGFAVGGSFRWADKAIAGYYGLIDPSGEKYSHPLADYNERAEIVFPDLNRPIYTEADESVDLWAHYTTRIMDDRVRMKIQLNVRDAFEGGRLQAVLFQPDGSPAQYRIRDGRSWTLQTTFDF